MLDTKREIVLEIRTLIEQLQNKVAQLEREKQEQNDMILQNHEAGKMETFGKAQSGPIDWVT